MNHPSFDTLEAGLEKIRSSPREVGRVEMIVRRPAVGAREILDSGELTPEEGLVGDSWHLRLRPWMRARKSTRETQLTLMNARAIALVAQDKARWELAGDQLYVDFDLSAANLPPGSRLAIGPSAIIEVSATPHTGCKKFAARFGADALQFVNSTIGRELQLRGINARIVQAGTINVGDIIRKVN